MTETLRRIADIRDQERMELMRITGRARRKLQMAELEHLGIPYQVRTDGSIMLLGGKIERQEPELHL